MAYSHDFEKKYHEILAKLILEDNFKNQFGELMQSDKPDIISTNNRFGCEVTRVLSNDFQEKGKYFNKHLKNKTLSEVDSKGLDRFCKGNYKILLYDDFKFGMGEQICTYLPPAVWVSSEPTIHAIKKKIDKINSTTYQVVTNLCLFAFGDLLCDYDDEPIMKEIFASSADYNREAEKHFDRLFINDWYNFHIYDFWTGTYEKRYIKDRLTPLCETARKLANQGE